MLVHELLAQGVTRSFEFFPPKSDEESATLFSTIATLQPLEPSFVSVTYRGGRESRQRTFDLVERIQSADRITAMAHLICVGHRRDEMAEILHHYLDAGVSNIMALGGDVPDDPDLVASDFAHASDLVALAREMGGFSIGVAAHPQGHPRSPSLASDRDFLASKLELADFAVTQFFFRADEWMSLVDDLATRGVTKPVVPGIMPVTALSSIDRMAAMGAEVPADVVARLRAAHERGGKDAVREEGIAAASELCRDLLAAGAPGLHFYTLNRSQSSRDIWSQIWP